MPEHIASISEIFEAYITILKRVKWLIDEDKSFLEYQQEFQWPLIKALENCSLVIAINPEASLAIVEAHNKFKEAES